MSLRNVEERVLLTIYGGWAALTLALWLLGAPTLITAMMLGGPVGWTIGLLIAVAVHRAARVLRK